MAGEIINDERPLSEQIAEHFDELREDAEFWHKAADAAISLLSRTTDELSVSKARVEEANVIMRTLLRTGIATPWIMDEIRTYLSKQEVNEQ